MIALLALLLGCPKGAVCEDRGDCADLQICDNGHCKTVDCATSEDCRIGEWCDPGPSECKPGCSQDEDCIAGEACNLENHQCEEYECRSTDLDCGLGEKCDDGECVDGMARSCDTCSDPLYYDYWTGQFTGGTGCGNNGTCVWFYYYADAPWCLEQCNPNAPEPCARGFECVDITGFDDYHCYAWCPSVTYELENSGN